MDTVQTGGILGIIHLIVWLVALFSILKSDKPIGSKVLWGIIVFALPCLGLILWMMFFDGKK